MHECAHVNSPTLVTSPQKHCCFPELLLLQYCVVSQVYKIYYSHFPSSRPKQQYLELSGHLQSALENWYTNLWNTDN